MAWAGPLFDGHVCSLGYQVVDWIEQYCCHGPGDVQGEPVVMDDEWLAFMVKAYEIDPHTGRRLIDRAFLSRPKGRAKSELAGLVVVAEALAPVRFDGWDAQGQPVARPVTSPLIKCLATEELQAGNTFENAAFIAGEWGPDNYPDVYKGISGSRRYQSATALYLPHGGEIRACTAGSASKDGGKETFVVPDETHLYVLPELRAMYATVARNTGKRMLAEPWMLQTSTAYRPGQQSVAEAVLTAWRKGELPNAERWLVDHREAKGRIDIADKAHTLVQLRYVYGAASDWIDAERIYRSMIDPTECEDEATAARYFLNRSVSTSDAWIATDVVDRQAKVDDVAAGESIALGFDGSLTDDATVLYGSRMSDGFIFPIGIWAKPAGPESTWWEVPRADVLASIREAFARYDVSRLYADPHEWRSDIDTLADEFGESRVIAWETRRDVQMAAALDRLRSDLMMGGVWHSGDAVMREHFGNAYVRHKGPHRLVRKEYPKSSRKIDSVVGATLEQTRTFDYLGNQAMDLQLEYERLSRYYDAIQRVEHLGLAVPPALRRFETVVDWPRLVVDAIDERLDIEGFRYPRSEVTDDELWRVWQANNLDEESPTGHAEAMIYGRSYITVGANEFDATTPLVTVESPRAMIGLVDARTRMVTAAARWYGNDEGDAQDPSEQGRLDPTLATLYLPGVTIWLEKTGGRWVDYDRDDHGLTDAAGRPLVPVIPLVNRYRASARWGRSEMYAAMSLTDSATRRLTGLEVAAETHAVPQRGVLGATKGDFVDNQGKPLPAWEAYFGAVWAIGNEKASTFQFSPSDLRNFHETVRLYAELLGTTYGLPSHYVRMAADNPPSADAIRSAEARLVKRAERKQQAFSGPWEAAMRLVRRFQLGRWDEPAQRLETVWRDPATPTKAAAADATVKLVSVGVLPIEAAWEDLGYSQAKRDRLRALREAERSDPTLERVARELVGTSASPGDGATASNG